jgi:hypothetical protein
MSDDRDKKDDPAEELKQGLTHLWRAARSVATGVKKEVERTDFGKAIDDAGREFVRAAANVVERIAEEVNELAKPPPPGAPPPAAEAKPEPEEHDEDDEFDGVRPKEKPAGTTPSEPGIRIAVDEGPDKKKPE